MNSRIVIIGGMGPQASLELHQRIVSEAAKAGATDNEDYPEILHVSIPIPDFISSGDSSAGLKRLSRTLDTLHFRKDDRVVLACNTAHLLLPKIESKYHLRFISLIQATVEAVRKSGAKKVGLLASPTTVKSGLYEKPLLKVGCEVLLPSDSDSEVLERAIRYVIAGGSAKDMRKLVEPIISRMIGDGSERVILGCTELSVIFSGTHSYLIVDPLKVVCDQLLI